MDDADAKRIIQQSAAKARQIEAAKNRQALPLRESITLAARIERFGSFNLNSIPESSRIPETDEAVWERNNRELKAKNILECSQIPGRYRNASLSALPPIEPEELTKYQAVANRLAAIIASVPQDAATVLLLGEPGTGKSYLGCAALNAAAARGLSVRYITPTEYFISVDDAMRGGDSVMAIEQKLLTPRVLVIDQAEERASTEAKQRLFVRLIDERYKAFATTILITNETRDVFFTRAGASIADRFQDDQSGCIECGWGSLRGRVRRDSIGNNQ